MEFLRKRATDIWVIIQERINDFYYEIECELSENPNDEELNDLNGIFGIVSSSTGAIEDIIINKISNDDALTIHEIREIKEIICAILYYLEQKINEYKNTTCYKDLGKIVLTLILFKNVILSLYKKCNYLEKYTLQRISK